MSGAYNQGNQENEQFRLFLQRVLRVLITSSSIINKHEEHTAPKT
jgi:hypothetical protein